MRLKFRIIDDGRFPKYNVEAWIESVNGWINVDCCYTRWGARWAARKYYRKKVKGDRVVDQFTLGE